MSKSKASVAKNAVYQTIYNILATITPLITTPIVSRELGPDKLGIFSYTLTVSQYFSVFAMLGITNYGTRAIAESDNKEQISRKFWSIYAIQSVMASLCVILYFLYILFFVSQNTSIFLMQVFWILSVLFDVNWFFFGLEEFKITVTRNIVIKFLTVLMIVIFVKKGNNPLFVYTLIMAGGNLLSVVAVLPLLKSRLDWYKPTWTSIKSHLKPIMVLFIPVISGVIFGTIDKLMLGSMSEYEQLGYYYNADRIINIPLTVISGVSTVLFPRISAMLSKEKTSESLKFISKAYDIVVWIAVLLAFGIAGCAREFVPLFFGNGYDSCVPIIYIMTPLLIVDAICIFYRMQYLVPFHHDKLYAWALLIGTIVNLLFNCFLIHSYKALGAAVATLISQIIVLCIQFKKHDGIDLTKWLIILGRYVIIGLLTFSAMRTLSTVGENELLTLALEIFVGGFVYLLLSVIYWRVKGELREKLNMLGK